MKGHVVIAPDKFKGSLTAPQVAVRIAAGLETAHGGGVPVVLLPVADGGDGTVDAVVAGGFTRVEVEVTGPTGERVLASYALQEEDRDALVGPGAGAGTGADEGSADLPVRRTAVLATT